MSSKTFLILGFFSLFLSFTACKQKSENEDKASAITKSEKPADALFFKLSLAQWSLHPLIHDGTIDPLDFARTASEMGFEGIEYVSGFYSEKLKDAKDPERKMQEILDTLKARSEKYNMRNVLIMVDGEGDLAANDVTERDKAVENHKKWIDAASFLGCHSIRVNLFGSDIPEEWQANSIDALKKLSAYGAEKNINVLVENHGLLSSNADLLVEVMRQVNMENCGTLPDFGNFCLKREGDARWDADCVEEYPRYEGVEKMMPYAKAVSAKSYTFNSTGEEELIDYKKMLKIVKEGGYSGYIGVEFEGEEDSAKEGIQKTKDLLIKAGRKL
ncbi:sugar phosphate isomerase/epimerase family protein [Christiangramia aestuarii]|nr:sugar phosphate isomerase/epimerase family protein [Christiangramia aestuarii]